LDKSKTQEENGGASRRHSLLGFSVLIHLATAIVSGNLSYRVRYSHLRRASHAANGGKW